MDSSTGCKSAVSGEACVSGVADILATGYLRLRESLPYENSGEENPDEPGDVESSQTAKNSRNGLDL